MMQQRAPVSDLDTGALLICLSKVTQTGLKCPTGKLKNRYDYIKKGADTLFNYPPMQSVFNNGYPSAVPYMRPWQPAQPPMETMHMQTPGIIKVNGRAGADAFQMNAPNAMVALFDANEDKFYIKMTDGAGYPTVETYRFARENDAAPAASPEFITRSEYDSFKSEIMEGIKNVQQFVFKGKPEPTGSAEGK